LLTVRDARTFISNYYLGQQIEMNQFEITDTSPMLCDTGEHDHGWEQLRNKNPVIWKDAALAKAGTEFARLIAAQRSAFAAKSPKPPVDYPEKAMNAAIISAWAYIAGVLTSNLTRLERHFSLADTAGRDPLNAAALAKGRHRTDPDNYRGLGYRTDTKERGRLVELFALQAEQGRGIAPSAIDVAIKKFHAKQAQLDVLKAQKAQSRGG
jgi:hypothetical protein